MLVVEITDNLGEGAESQALLAAINSIVDNGLVARAVIVSG